MTIICILITSIIRNILLLTKSTFVNFVHFAKAFDGINHSLLWYRHLNNGICGKIYHIIKTLHTNAEAKHNSKYNNGNKLFYYIPRGKANKMKIKDSGLIASDAVTLKRMINLLYEWCCKWRLSVNLDKTKIVHFRRKVDTIIKYYFKWGNQSLAYTNTYRYLGLHLNEHLEYNHTVQVLSLATSRSLGGLLYKYYKNKGLYYITFTKLYENTVVPVFSYSSSVWGYKHQARIDVIQNRAMRLYLGCGKTAAILAMEVEMGWKLKGYT